MSNRSSSWPDLIAVTLAVLGALAVVAGVALVHLPSAFIVAGVLFVFAGYVVRYFAVGGDAA